MARGREEDMACSKWVEWNNMVGNPPKGRVVNPLGEFHHGSDGTAAMLLPRIPISSFSSGWGSSACVGPLSAEDYPSSQFLVDFCSPQLKSHQLAFPTNWARLNILNYGRVRTIILRRLFAPSIRTSFPSRTSPAPANLVPTGARHFSATSPRHVTLNQVLRVSLA